MFDDRQITFLHASHFIGQFSIAVCDMNYIAR